jgi:uncharacterized protein YabE (DUF348 family)
MNLSTYPKSIRLSGVILLALVAVGALLAACTATLPAEPNRVTLAVDGEHRIIVTELATVRDLLTDR